MTEPIEFEETLPRNEVAATLRRLADGIEAGTVRLGNDDAGLAVPVGDDIEVEIEFEDEEGTVGIEVELEWSGPDEPAGAGDEPLDPVHADEEAGLPIGPDGPRESLARFEVFRDRAEEWRWRLVHRNGNVIATSGEGYTRKHNAENGLRSVMQNASGAELREE